MKVKPLDFVTIIFTVAFITLYILNTITNSNNNNYLKVEVEGKEFLYPLNVNRIETFHGLIGETTIEINDGEAFFIDSPCKNKTCIKMGHISHNGESAACLPNRIIINITGDDKGEIDAGTY